MDDPKPLIQVNNLKTQFPTDRGNVKAVDGVSFTIHEGETVGFVGESGAGKSVTGQSILRLIESPGRIVDGEVLFEGENLFEMSEEELRSIRGKEISVVFQDAATAFNPAFTIGEQITDTILEHKDVTKEEARDRAIELLEDVQIPDAANRVDDYPHQFSGGMQQRALIALSLSCDPKLIIADEITTGLDVTTQAQILDLLKDLQKKHNLAIHLITHNMAVIGEMCERVAVMYAGRIIEMGPMEEIFTNPSHPYTSGLLNSLPQSKGPGEELKSIPGNMPDLIQTPSGCSFRDRCQYEKPKCAEIEPPLEPLEGSSQRKTACIRTDEIDLSDTGVSEEKAKRQRTQSREETTDERGDVLVEAKDIQKYFDPESQDWLDILAGNRQYVHAVDGVSLTIQQGETLGLVGESGCGKTTLGRTITRLYEPDDGTILFAGKDLTEMRGRKLRKTRTDYQVIFQDPFSSLNPRRTVENIIGRPLEIHGKVSNADERRERVIELLEEVGLEESHLDRYAHEFSGGQKQRIGIARALAVEPDFIVCDEPVSALDVSVQAKILNLMMNLQDKYGFTYLFIAHDLNVVRHISDRIAVMYLGEIVEIGTMDQIFERPYHPYTEILLSSIPQPFTESPDRKKPEGQVPSPINPPEGCRFQSRCPYAMEECGTISPELLDTDNGHRISCHIFDDDFMEKKDASAEELIARQVNPFGSVEGQNTLDATGSEDTRFQESDD